LNFISWCDRDHASPQCQVTDPFFKTWDISKHRGSKLPIQQKLARTPCSQLSNSNFPSSFCFDKPIILGTSVMYNVIDRLQTQSADQSVAKSEPTYQLSYRGTTYEVPSHKPLTRSPEEVAQLVGKRLTYRGTTYEIVPASVSDVSLPWVAHQLCYRGVTYTSYAKPNLSGLDYAVVSFT
jgi:Domain of unknown function (DUF4278)